MEANYFWVRIYDYNVERDHVNKGTLLDEFYLKDVEGGRESVKGTVVERYCGRTAVEMKFAKPRKKDGIYAIIMDSERFFFERFYATIDTYCFYCHKPIKGKASEFPRDYIGDDSYYLAEDSVFTDQEKTAYFCKHECKAEFRNIRRHNEGAFQGKEEGNDGEIFGYIYLIYNRKENIYYVGQTRYLPFFRWQEHVKDGSKGEISDLSFSVLAEVGRSKNQEMDQQYLNSVEAWWINKFKDEQHEVFNISKPKITVAHLKERFQDMVEKQGSLILN